jgi:hypothetical protein
MQAWLALRSSAIVESLLKQCRAVISGGRFRRARRCVFEEVSYLNTNFRVWPDQDAHCFGEQLVFLPCYVTLQILLQLL